MAPRWKNKRREQDRAIERRLNKSKATPTPTPPSNSSRRPKVRQRKETVSAAPIITTGTKRNKRAEATLRTLKSQKGQPIKGAGGLMSGRRIYDMPGQPGHSVHDLEFGRRTNSGEDFAPRKTGSKENAALRRAAIAYQMGEHLREIPVGDGVQATPLNSERGNKHNARARIYDRMTKGALKSKLDDGGFGYIRSLKLGKKKWFNVEGETIKFNPKELKSGLLKLAAGEAVRRHGRVPSGGIVPAEAQVATDLDQQILEQQEKLIELREAQLQKLQQMQTQRAASTRS